MLKRIALSALTLGAIALAEPVFASFHLMQIEQVIGGVNGDTSRQAIQLRMRDPGQNFVNLARVRAWDATGNNPVLLVDMVTSVGNGALGARVLLATNGFLSPTLIPDFVMQPIPAAYLPAGKITFEDDSGNVWWGFAWGGAAYTGTNTGFTVAQGGNDADGNFNPPFAGPLPSSNTQAVRFTGAATAQSANNAADYALTPGAAVFTKNDGSNGTVPVELMDFKVQ
jgi:hypothetical protein